MSTTLPADPETERLAKALAKAKGKPVASVVREAIEATAEAAGVVPPPRRPVDMDKIRAILARVDALPVLDHRPADEIIGYDDFGLPR
jgi:antitoxin VapB